MPPDASAQIGDQTSPARKGTGADVLAVIVLFLAMGLMVVESRASSLLFDELLTWVTATLPTPQMIWRSLVTAPLPLDPPLYHWIEHYAIQALGQSDFAIRFPSAIGLLAALWGIYVFTVRTGDRIAGVLAMAIAVASGALFYGYNARPYGLVLAAAAGALVSWQNIVRGRSHLRWVICFGICLAIADSLHYYSALIAVPFAAAELVRGYRRGKLDWPVLFAMAAGNAVMIAFLPLMPAARAYQAGYFRGVQSGDWLASYRMFFYSLTIIAAVVCVTAAACMVRWQRRKTGPGGSSVQDRGPKPEETTALAGFAFYPAIVLALGLIATHTFAERFTLPAIFGLSILPALALRTLLKKDIFLVIAGALILIFPFLHAIRASRSARGVETRFSAVYAGALAKQTAAFGALPETSRIVMSDPVLFLRTMKYAPEPVRRRLALLDLVASPTSAGRKDTGEMVVLGVRKGIGLPVLTLDQMSGLTDPFFLVCCRGFEKLDDRLLPVLREIRNAGPPDSGAFWYWPVFIVRPDRLRAGFQ